MKLTEAQKRTLLIFRYGEFYRLPRLRREKHIGFVLPKARGVGLREDVCERLVARGLMRRGQFGMYELTDEGSAMAESIMEPAE